VTRNIEKAIQEFRLHANVRHEVTFANPVEVTTPSGRCIIHSKIALMWVDDLQYEFIKPVGGSINIYRDGLPDDDTPKFHHICMGVEDWAAFRASVNTQPFPIIFEGSGTALKFLYLDARPLLGHILEFTWMALEAWKAMGGR
jgi:hypothetical protein